MQAPTSHSFILICASRDSQIMSHCNTCSLTSEVTEQPFKYETVSTAWKPFKYVTSLNSTTNQERRRAVNCFGRDYFNGERILNFKNVPLWMIYFLLDWATKPVTIYRFFGPNIQTGGFNISVFRLDNSTIFELADTSGKPLWCDRSR